jgi:hypothetical protein
LSKWSVAVPSGAPKWTAEMTQYVLVVPSTSSVKLDDAVVTDALAETDAVDAELTLDSTTSTAAVTSGPMLVTRKRRRDMPVPEMFDELG